MGFPSTKANQCCQCQYAQVVDKGFRNYVPWPLCPIAVVARLHMPGIDLSSHNS